MNRGILLYDWFLFNGQTEPYPLHVIINIQEQNLPSCAARTIKSSKCKVRLEMCWWFWLQLVFVWGLLWLSQGGWHTLTSSCSRSQFLVKKREPRGISPTGTSIYTPLTILFSSLFCLFPVRSLDWLPRLYTHTELPAEEGNRCCHWYCYCHFIITRFCDGLGFFF